MTTSTLGSSPPLISASSRASHYKRQEQKKSGQLAIF
jgi:hypothetical protein